MPCQEDQPGVRRVSDLRRATNRCGLSVNRSQEERRANPSMPYQQWVWIVRQQIAGRTPCQPSMPYQRLMWVIRQQIALKTPCQPSMPCQKLMWFVCQQIASRTPCQPLNVLPPTTEAESLRMRRAHLDSAVPEGTQESHEERRARGNAGVARPRRAHLSAPCQRARQESHIERRAHLSTPCQGQGRRRTFSAVPTLHGATTGTCQENVEDFFCPQCREHKQAYGITTAWPNIASQVTPLARPANRVHSGNVLLGKPHGDHGKFASGAPEGWRWASGWPSALREPRNRCERPSPLKSRFPPAPVGEFATIRARWEDCFNHCPSACPRPLPPVEESTSITAHGLGMMRRQLMSQV